MYVLALLSGELLAQNKNVRIRCLPQAVSEPDLPVGIGKMRWRVLEKCAGMAASTCQSFFIFIFFKDQSEMGQMFVFHFTR